MFNKVFRIYYIYNKKEYKFIVKAKTEKTALRVFRIYFNSTYHKSIVFNVHIVSITNSKYNKNSLFIDTKGMNINI